MHYEIDYSDMSETRKRRKALLDCREFLGKARFAVIRAELRKLHAPLGVWHTVLSFAGIQGYPVRVLYETYAPKTALWFWE